MYVHAWQSYIFNRVLSERIKQFGCMEPIEGDLVYVDGVGSGEGEGEGEDLGVEEVAVGREGKEEEMSLDADLNEGGTFLLLIPLSDRSQLALIRSEKQAPKTSSSPQKIDPPRPSPQAAAAAPISPSPERKPVH